MSEKQQQWLLWLSGGMLTFVTTCMVLLANAVIANDRVRASEDEKIKDKIEIFAKENQFDHTKIISQLTRIETLISK